MILEYFMVVGISQKRIFVDRPRIVFDMTEECKPTSKTLEIKFNNTWTEYPLYASRLAGGNPGTTSSVGCYDCRTYGGTITKPEFWEN